jgi:E3 ubiquitin-protein ligase UBR7
LDYRTSRKLQKLSERLKNLLCESEKGKMDGEENGQETGEEQVLRITEFVEQMEAQQLEADLVLGGDEGNECTYEKGYMKRQAVFSCLTCVPDGNAGFCTACSLTCHDGHEVVELWTRRAFRCDCGNEKFGAVECKLYKGKEKQNKGNVYNHNYRGLYCSCHRPYPDPEGAEHGDMLQCCICEDWFHENHLGLSSLEQVPRDESGVPSFDELICPSCVTTCSFLSEYQDIFELPLPVGADDRPPTLEVSGEGESVSSQVSTANGNVLVSGPSSNKPTSSDSARASASNADSSRQAEENGVVDPVFEAPGKANVETAVGESSNGGVLQCKLKPGFHEGLDKFLGNGDATTSRDVETVGNSQLKPGQAIFLSKSWRTELCRCSSCQAMYAAKGLSFLLDTEDTLQEYEETAKRKRVESRGKDEATAENFMKKLGHVQKMELVNGINDMATEFGSFLAPFSQEGKTVTSADIYEFFENLQQKRRRLNQN